MYLALTAQCPVTNETTYPFSHFLADFIAHCTNSGIYFEESKKVPTYDPPNRSRILSDASVNLQMQAARYHTTSHSMESHRVQAVCLEAAGPQRHMLDPRPCHGETPSTSRLM